MNSLVRKEIAMRLRFVAGTMALLLLLAQPCLADVLITMKIQSDAVPEADAPAGQQTSTTWLADNKLREDSGDRSTIVDLDAKKLFVIDHTRKAYYALDLPIDIMAGLPDDIRADLEAMIANMNIQVKVTPTGESKKIGGYESKRYLIEVGGANVMKVTRDQWMTEDIGFDIGAFKGLMQTLLSAQPMGADWLKQIWEIKGFPVLAESSVEVMGNTVRTREELVSVEKREPAADTYAPPAGYTAEAFDFLKMLQQGG
jgi:hypothetical protein